MNIHYRDYFWKQGKPYGINPITELGNEAISYKIVSDPYFKRISIEKYAKRNFEKIIYDSIFLDFRKLKPDEQYAWQRELILEEAFKQIYLLRDQNDRIILTETLVYQDERCIECQINAIQGVPISIHRMYYEDLKHPFNGVVLYDMEEHPVMFKSYKIDPNSGEFTEIIKEQWSIEYGWRLSNA